MTRRDSFMAALAAPLTAAAALAAKAHTQKAAPVRDIVRQSEIQAIMDLSNGAEIAAAAIIRRLQAGAGFERGKWGVDTMLQTTLSWYEEEENGGIGHIDDDSYCGLHIAPAETVKKSAELWPPEDRDPGEFLFA
jgi:hypothetical protein